MSSSRKLEFGSTKDNMLGSSSLPETSFFFPESPESRIRNYMNFSPQEKNKKKSTKTPFIIGIAGGTASGKTTVTNSIVKHLGDQRVAVVAQDSFYKTLNTTQQITAKKNEYNFDHPDAFDTELLFETLQSMKKGKKVQIPVYDFVTHSRSTTESCEIFGADVIIIEGILILYSKELRELMNLKIFVDTDADTRLARRIKRDISERGRDLSGVLTQYEKFVKPSFDDYISPTKKFADIIVPRGGDNLVAIDLLVQHVNIKLNE
eukprot:gene3963-7219_t